MGQTFKTTDQQSRCAKTDVEFAQKNLKALQPDLRKANAELAEATMELDDLRKGALVVFADLSARTTPPEPIAEEEEVEPGTAVDAADAENEGADPMAGPSDA